MPAPPSSPAGRTPVEAFAALLDAFSRGDFAGATRIQRELLRLGYVVARRPPANPERALSRPETRRPEMFR